jgi:hypothetical protein
VLRALAACLVPTPDAVGCLAAATATMCIAAPVLPQSAFAHAAALS